MAPKNYLLQVLMCFYLVGLYEHVKAENFYVVLKNTNDSKIMDSPGYWYVYGTKGFSLELSCTDIVLPKRVKCLKGALSISDEEGLVKVCSVTSSYIRRTRGTYMHVKLLANAPLVPRAKCTARLLTTDMKQDPQTSCLCGRKSEMPLAQNEGANKVNRYTFLAYLKRSEDKSPFCGGSILTERHILSSADCVYQSIPKYLEVIVGGFDMDTGLPLPSLNTKNDLTQIINGQKVFGRPHDDYSGPKVETNNIGLVVLSRDIRFNPWVGPVCLPSRQYHLDNPGLPVLGWYVRPYNVSGTAEVPVVDWKGGNKTDDEKKLFSERQTKLFFRVKPEGEEVPGAPFVYWDSELHSYVQLALSTNQVNSTKPDVISFKPDVLVYFDWIQSKLEENNSLPAPYNTCEDLEIIYVRAADRNKTRNIH